MTSIETGPTWSERLNPRNWTLAWKLVVVGLVPALLALALGVLRISDQAGAAAQLGQGSALLTAQSKVDSAADALRQERDQSTLFVAARRTGDRNALSAGFGQIDSTTTAALAALRAVDSLNAATTAVLGEADTELRGLTGLRRDVTDSPAVAATQVRDRYTSLVARFDRLGGALLDQVSTPDTATLTGALRTISDAKEQLALQHTVLGAAIRASQLQPADADLVAATGYRLASAAADYQSTVSAEEMDRSGPLVDKAADARRQALANEIVATPAGRPVVVSPVDLDAAFATDLATASRTADLIRQDVAAAGKAAEATASNLAGINSVILMLGLLVGITIAILVARSLIRSLRVLRTAALDVAERRLPQAVESMRAGETPDVTVDPVPLNSRDEVGQVARAFDAVHGQAVRLAADQAALQSNVSAMFVNLSRRSQALVERQLQLIEQLESNEQDADQLSNLFQLDHLATRMRRNSENLLVLAGTDLAKRNIAPVPMVDVLRAAVSEVEQYQRIVVQAPPTATIVGRAGSDLVHLLAELLDNATNFSPPDSQVVMSTTRTSDGSIVVEIADRGVGMIDHELSDANQRLGGPSTVDVSASRRMGLFVVGRLGARHGIGVRLTTSAAGGPGAGLTASVTVPAYLVPAGEPAQAGRPIGVPQPAGVPAQAGRSLEVPPQRANGAGRPGSLSALVAGTDGPANPAGTFDGTEGSLFGTAPAGTNGGGTNAGGTNGGGTNAGGTNAGGTNALPSRRPGSSLRPEGPPPELPSEPSADAHDGAPDEDEAEQAAAARLDEQRRAREVADQARKDQEAAAERSAQARAAQRERDAEPEARTPQPEAQQPETRDAARPPTETPADTDGSDTVRRAAHDGPGAHPQPFLAPAPFAGRLRHGDEAADQVTAAEPDTESGDENTGSVDERPSAAGQRIDQQNRGERPGPLPTGRNAPPVVSPPTTPMPTVRPGSAAPAPRPAEAPRQATPPAYPPPVHQPTAQAPAVQRPAAFPPQRPDELFAPSVPIIAEPERAAAEAQAGFERGETTPIFEEIASAWFRSNRPVPVTWATEDGDESPPASEAPATRAHSPIIQAPPVPTPPATPAPAPPRVEPRLPQRPPAPAAATAPAPTPRPVARPVEPDPEPVTAAASAFAGAADEGWRAANGIETERPDELTSAGLPKRRPRARLVPGSAGSAVLSPPVTASRSAETVRGRLASYQQGVRQGRETRARGEAGTATDTTHDEENS